MSAIVIAGVAKRGPFSELAKTSYFIFLFALLLFVFLTPIRIPYSYSHPFLLLVAALEGRRGWRGQRPPPPPASLPAYTPTPTPSLTLSPGHLLLFL